MKLKQLAWIIGTALAVIVLFYLPIQSYSENVWYNGETISGCTARKYLFRGVIATAPNGTKYHWNESTKQWNLY